MADYPEYRVVPYIGHHWEHKYALQQKYSYYAHHGDRQLTYGWHNCCTGTKEFCEEALKRRERR